MPPTGGLVGAESGIDRRVESRIKRLGCEKRIETIVKNGNKGRVSAMAGRSESGEKTAMIGNAGRMRTAQKMEVCFMGIADGTRGCGERLTAVKNMTGG